MSSNPSLERTATGVALGPRCAQGYRPASRAKRHTGVGPLSSNYKGFPICQAIDFLEQSSMS